MAFGFWTIVLHFVVCCRWISVSAVRPQVDWCSIPLRCGLLPNSMCYMKLLRSREYCLNFEDAMTPNRMTRILDIFNSYRDNIASGNYRKYLEADGMRKLQWDDTLALQAKMWAYQCNDTGDPCPKHPEYPWVAQAAIEIGYEDMYTTPTVDKLIGTMIYPGWTLPHEVIFKYKQNHKYHNWAQISFAKAHKVGCAFVKFLRITLDHYLGYSRALWCNFNYGIEDGDEVWHVGEGPCKNCPTGFPCNPKTAFKHLCAAPGDTGGSFTLPQSSTTFSAAPGLLCTPLLISASTVSALIFSPFFNPLKN